jgi:hypothetical protein
MTDETEYPKHQVGVMLPGRTVQYEVNGIVQRDPSNLMLCDRIAGQVGIMIHGTTIENTVMGGPAYNSHQIERGDVILKIDGKTATSDNVKDLLVGKDVPGSNINISIAKGSPQVRFMPRII